MWVRKKLDLGWGDLWHGFAACFLPCRKSSKIKAIEQIWSKPSGTVVCLSVRSGFDLLLSQLNLPAGSEVLVSAITIPDIARILESHGLVPVPIDLEAETLAPNLDLIRQAITPKTRAILVAHLLGSRIDLQPIAKIASNNGLMLIEDCAQAYCGKAYHGHPSADVSMFSFGPIKASTALGGAVLALRDSDLAERIRQAQATYPVQTRLAFLGRISKYALLKILSTQLVFEMVVFGYRLLGKDHDTLVKASVRGFSSDQFLANIRRKPSSALLSLLYRRLKNFDPRRADKQSLRGQFLLNQLRSRVACPTADVRPHTFWVFVVTVSNPQNLITKLQAAGFDTTQTSSLVVVAPPENRAEIQCSVAESVLSQMVFLPCYAAMPESELQRMSKVLLEATQEVLLKREKERASKMPLTLS